MGIVCGISGGSGGSLGASGEYLGVLGGPGDRSGFPGESLEASLDTSGGAWRSLEVLGSFVVSGTSLGASWGSPNCFAMYATGNDDVSEVSLGACKFVKYWLWIGGRSTNGVSYGEPGPP